MGTFLDEFDEHLATLNSGFIVLEKLSPESEEYAESVRRLFRATHSLKGAARSVDIEYVEKICHELEDVLGQMRECPAKPSTEVFSMLLMAVDALSQSRQKLRDRQPVEEGDVKEMLEKLRQATRQLYSNDPVVELALVQELDLPAFEQPAASTKAPAGSAQTSAGSADTPAPVPTTPEASLSAVTDENNGHGTFENAVPGKLENQSASLRVSAQKLDALLSLSGEFLTSYGRSQIWYDKVYEFADTLRLCANGASRHSGSSAQERELKDLSKEIERFLATMKSEIRTVGDTARLVDEEIRGLRMRPFSDACLGLQLAVRELSVSTGKKMEVEVLGGTVELDRSVLECLSDPLLHIIRNAVQHGVESPEQRARAGKPETSAITISAALQGSHVQIEVRDDGGGIDEESVRTQAAKNGLPAPQNHQELMDLIFLPWFSTSKQVDAVAGRGVGLDVVASQISALQGTVTVTSQKGMGTCFTLTVPLTLTKIRALLTSVGGQTFAFPCANVRRLLRIDPGEFRFVKGSPVLSFEGNLVSVSNLSEVLKLPKVNGQHQKGSRLPAVVVSHGSSFKAFLVDQLIAEQEVVVTGLGARLEKVRNISGATLLANGEIALILNTSDLFKRNLPPIISTGSNNGAPDSKQKHIIVCDDSPTTRILETSILESAGYKVDAFPDAEDAWEALQSTGADLIVSDVEMPRMDGFALTSTVRNSEKWRNLPVILVTGLHKESDKERGLQAGASAYVVKGEFDQTELIETIERLI